MNSYLSSLFSVAGRRAIVTGASGSLGAQFARCLAQAGADVVLAARRIEPMEALRDELIKIGACAHVVSIDLEASRSVDDAFRLAQDWAGAPIDIVINNSGIASPNALLDQSEDEWNTVMTVNLNGARRVANAAVRRMIDAGVHGSIVNVASILGVRQGAGVAAYATSKAALVQLTKQQALEWARHNIRVNALAPGYIETDLNRDYFATDAGAALVRRIPMRRLGQSHELEGALLYLASDAGSFVTGAIQVVDGGHLLSTL